jgi:predicted MFS family arabinose efflux permease
MASTSDLESRSRRNRFIISLALALFATGMLDVLASLFLVDIAGTFLGSTSKLAVGTASLIVTVSSVAAVAAGLLNGFLSVKFNHKLLLLIGATCIIVGSTGCFLAPHFAAMLIFYPFDGIGTVIVGSMAFTLIGELLPLDKRANAIGWVTAGGILASAIGFPVAGFIAALAGWRSYLLWYSLPISIIALTLALIIIPSQRSQLVPVTPKPVLESFKQVLLNKSATACLVGSLLINAAGVWSFYAATFWRKEFSITVQVVGVITFALVMAYAVGSVIGGKLVNKLGRKKLVVYSWIARGLLIAAIVLMPNFWSAFITSLMATLIGGVAIASGHSLYLEQVPKARGTMMSTGAVFASIGVTVGVSVGGLALSAFGFQLLGVTLGFFAIISGFIIYFFAKDFCQAQV